MEGGHKRRDQTAARMTSAIRSAAWPSQSGIVHGAGRRGRHLADGRRIVAQQVVGAEVDGHRPLSVRPQGEAGDAQRGRLLLDAPGICQDRPGARLQGQETEIGQRGGRASRRLRPSGRRSRPAATWPGCEDAPGTRPDAAPPAGTAPRRSPPGGRGRRRWTGGAASPARRRGDRARIPPTPPVARRGARTGPASRSSCCRRHGSGPPRSPRQSGSAPASGLWVNSSADNRSVSTRLISSGIAQSRERRPASTWATGTSSLAAASAHASVPLTSPPTTTIDTCGSSSSTCSNPIRMRPVCSPWAPEPTRRNRSGAGKARSSSMSADMAAS